MTLECKLKCYVRHTCLYFLNPAVCAPKTRNSNMARRLSAEKYKFSKIPLFVNFHKRLYTKKARPNKDVRHLGICVFYMIKKQNQRLLTTSIRLSSN